ncbi:hypothetical protein XA68_13353 [Ophiocordyceps unilateralis]|uniref:Uncharacterized protein n=1 Tax=Ophiocordyceps unilateralis TaxID=268505 RepID=A0A2A9PCT1_OPHUN|nr:hypothetical protein XA68_13353 [Ophiocordyceps unilateralis]
MHEAGFLYCPVDPFVAGSELQVFVYCSLFLSLCLSLSPPSLPLTLSPPLNTHNSPLRAGKHRGGETRTRSVSRRRTDGRL